MTTAQKLARLRRLRTAIDHAQDHVRMLSDKRDEIIADMLIEHEATGDVIGQNAGVSQPRTVQIKNSVVLRRETAAIEAKAENRRAARRRSRAKSKSTAALELVEAS